MTANEDNRLRDFIAQTMAQGKMRATRLRVSLIQTLEDEEKTMSLPEIIAGMHSADPIRIMVATNSLREYLMYYPVEDIIKAGLVKLLVTFLGYDDNPILQREAARTLAYFAYSGTSQQTYAIAEAGGVPQLICLLSSPDVDVVDSCVWALGNIIGDGEELRDFVIESGILTPLMCLVDMNAPLNLLREVTWVILNLCRNNQPPPNLETINVCLSVLKSLIQHTDYEILSHTCWALSYVLDGTSNLIQQVVESPGVVSRLVELLNNPEPYVIEAALQTILRIASGDDSQTQAVIDCNVLQMLPGLLQHPDVDIKEIACWVLSNITGGSSEQIQAVINCNLLPLVVEVLNTGDFKSQCQATWVIIALTGRGTLEQINYVVQCGTLKSLCDLLTTEETKLLKVLLDAISSLLETTKKFGQVEPLCVMLKEIGGFDKIEKLQNHVSNGVCNRSYLIIDKFFSYEVEGEELEPENINNVD